MLERQIMFKQLQELQRQKKLQESNEPKQQNVTDQVSLMGNKPSSGALFGQINKGIAVRDPSSMFMFGDTKLINGLSDQLVFSQPQNQVRQPMCGNSSGRCSRFQGLAHKYSALLTENESLQAGAFGKSFTGDQISGSSNEDMVTLDPLEQKILFNTEDETSGSIFESTDKSVDFPSLQSGSWSALMQSAVREASSSDGGVQEEWSGLSFQKPVVPKAEIDEASTPSSYSNNSSSPYFGLRLTPTSQRPVVNCSDPSRISKQAPTTHNKPLNKNYITKQSRLATLSFGGSGQQTFNSAVSQETSHLVSVKKEDGEQWSTQPPNRWTDVPVQQKPSAMHEPPSASYVPNSRMGTASGSLSENTIADGHSLKQAGSPPHNIFSVKAAVKNEREHYDNKIPQITSPCNLNSAYGNDKSHPFDQLVKRLSQPLGSLKSSSSLVQVGSIVHCGSVVPVTGTNTAAHTPSSSVYLQHLDVANQNMAKSKKRKYPAYELLSWHKEVTEGRKWLHDMSAAELEWAHSVGRLPAKSKELAKEIADPLSMVHHRKRRLDLTTQLMQLLFRAPAVILSEDTTAHCDSVTYYAARLALGDACNLCSPSGKNITSEWSSDQDLSKTVEGLVDKSKRLHDELSRMEKGESTILEVRVDFQDLEKFSVINRFAKLHARGALVTGDTGSTVVSSSKPKLYPQRYVKASPMPNTIPQGQKCLSL